MRVLRFLLPDGIILKLLLLISSRRGPDDPLCTILLSLLEAIITHHYTHSNIIDLAWLRQARATPEDKGVVKKRGENVCEQLLFSDVKCQCTAIASPD